jgi:hypothetical protein
MFVSSRVSSPFEPEGDIVDKLMSSLHLIICPVGYGLYGIPSLVFIVGSTEYREQARTRSKPCFGILRFDMLSSGGPYELGCTGLNNFLNSKLAG